MMLLRRSWVAWRSRVIASILLLLLRGALVDSEVVFFVLGLSCAHERCYVGVTGRSERHHSHGLCLVESFHRVEEFHHIG